MERKAATRPFVDGIDPDQLDKKLAPEGVHVFSMFTPVGARRLEPGAAPRRARGRTPTGSSTCTRSSRRTSRRAVIDRQVIGPYDMEQELGLIGGNIFHGELSRRSAVPHAARRRATPTTARRSRACTTARSRHPRRRRRERHPRLAGVRAGRRRTRRSRRSSRVSDAGARPTAGPPSSACSRRGRVAVVGASVREGSLGSQMLIELSTRRVRRRHLPGEPQATTRSSGSAVLSRRWPSRARARRPRHPRASRTRSLEEQLRAPPMPAPGRRRDLRQRVRGAARRASRRSPSGSAPIARDAGMAVCGGNCMGFLNLERGLRALGFSSPTDAPVGGRSRSCRTRARSSPRCSTTTAASGSTSLVSPGQEFVTTMAEYMAYALRPRRTQGRRAVPRDRARPGRVPRGALAEARTHATSRWSR